MSKNQHRYIADLLFKCYNRQPAFDQLPEADKALLNDWRQQDESNELFFQQVLDGSILTTFLSGVQQTQDRNWPILVSDIRTARLKKQILRWSAAAAVIALIGFGAIRLWNGRSATTSTERPEMAASGQDILPGGNKAILTLADGRKISLDSLAKDGVSQQGGASLTLMEDGGIAYRQIGYEKAVTNELAVPNGGTYRVELSDGSKVWLNAASKLKYSTNFNFGAREVTLMGEGYFEIAHRSGEPFIVHVQNELGEVTDVKVLGTHFNINGYPENNAVATTLLEGGVLVSKGQASLKLIPGQQAIAADSKDKIDLNKQPDVDAIQSWKHGEFYFNGQNTMAVLHEIARWYDLELVATDIPKQARFRGSISKSVAITDLMPILKSSEIDVELKGRKLFVK